MMAWMQMAVPLLAIVFQQQILESMEHLALVIVQPNVIQLPPTNVQVYDLDFDIVQFTHTILSLIQ